ncbi:MAG: restriction endonuclease subunit S [Endomicrobium sp.]|jgi:hypothetical protein|nr:restriction endonuclease subunit S [Endomicrobium sp.]
MLGGGGVNNRPVWREFQIGGLFTVERGKRLINSNRKTGNLAYYSAAESNNGLTDFINNPLFTTANKLIHTTFGDVYYVKNKFTASDEITILDNEKLNRYVGLFLSKVMNNNKNKFAFGYKAFTERVKRQTILIPVDNNGNPDYAYMENYMRNIEIKKISQYVKFLKYN